MKCSVLLLAILMVTLLDRSCAQMPVTGESSSGIDTPEEATMDTWQYCIVDNSTILKLDTGEQLDIAYTSNNTLVVILNHSQTAVVLPRLYNELACSMYDSPEGLMLPTSFYIFLLIGTVIILSISGRNIVIHILYKKLNNPIGKLLLWYSIFIILRSISFFMLSILVYTLSRDFHNEHVCHLLKLIHTANSIGYEAIATCILMHTAHNLWQSDKMRPVDPSKYKVFTRRYFWYVTCTVAISMFIVLTYDVGASKGDLSGYCERYDPIYRTMLAIMQAVVLFNKVVQMALFVIYLHYWRKLRSVTNQQTDKKLFRIAVGMGATISISEFVYILNWIISLATGARITLVELIGSMMLILQHCIITGLLKRPRKACSCKKEVVVTS